MVFIRAINTMNFREETFRLPNNKALALTRLRQLQRKFSKDSKYKEDYVTFMQNIIECGHAEKVPDDELTLKDGKTWYIPHHGVCNSKKPDKIRVVFDCSARYEGVLLNDCLLKGPDLTNDLVGVLCRFRQDSVAVVCDIEQMFYQFKVNKEDFYGFRTENAVMISLNIAYRAGVEKNTAALNPSSISHEDTVLPTSPEEATSENKPEVESKKLSAGEEEREKSTEEKVTQKDEPCEHNSQEHSDEQKYSCEDNSKPESEAEVKDTSKADENRKNKTEEAKRKKNEAADRKNYEKQVESKVVEPPSEQIEAVTKIQGGTQLKSLRAKPDEVEDEATPATTIVISPDGN
ncbi:hypothetical protein ScPMuIL_009901 [Solemya velum]